MVKRIALIMLLLGAFGTIFAQQWITIGNPNTTLSEGYPFYRYYNYSTWEYLYLQNEINYAGNITQMQFYTHSTGATPTTIENVTIYMKETTAVTYSDGDYNLDGYTLVWQGTWPNSATGWQGVTLATPFYFSNTKNLSILILKGYQPRIPSYPLFRYTATSPNYRGRRAASDNSQPSYLYASTNTNRANLRIYIVPHTGIKNYVSGRDSPNLTIRPNPTKGLMTVFYNLPTKDVATLKIYNILGDIVYSAKTDKGLFTIRKRLPAGIYLLRLEAKGYKEERKLIVVK